MPEFQSLAADRGLGLLEDSCEALGAHDSEGRQVGSRGNLATFAFYANKQLATGEGGMVVRARPGDGGAAAQRAQPGPGAGHGLGRPRPARLQLPAHGRAGRDRRRAARAPRRDAGGRGRESPAMYTERLAALDYGAPAGAGDPAGLVLPCADRGDERRSWFVYAVRLPGGADRDAVLADLAQRGIEAKAYMPCIHLMRLYRERFGFREGQFPVAEDASARLLALPFFASITEQQIDRVCEALAEALLGDWT